MCIINKISVNSLGRKFLNRNKNEEFDQDYEEGISDEDFESSAKKKMERVGPTIDDVDPYEVVTRQIALEKDLAQPKTKEERVKEEIKIAGHQTRTTNQFQKYVNAHIEDRVSKIDSIKKAKEQFDKDIQSLKAENFENVEQLSKLSVNELASNALEEMLQSLEINVDITRSKLDYFKNRVQSTEKELIQQEMNIEKIRQEIQKKRSQEQESRERVNTIKDEVEILGKKYNIDELRKVIDTLNKSKKEST